MPHNKALETFVQQLEQGEIINLDEFPKELTLEFSEVWKEDDPRWEKLKTQLQQQAKTEPRARRR